MWMSSFQISALRSSSRTFESYHDKKKFYVYNVHVHVYKHTIQSTKAALTVQSVHDFVVCAAMCTPTHRKCSYVYSFLVDCNASVTCTCQSVLSITQVTNTL